MRSRLLLATVICTGLFAASACSSGGSGGVLAKRSDASAGSAGSGAPGDTTGTGGSTVPGDGTGNGTGDGGAFDWTDANPGDDTVQVGHLQVPYDYTDPSLGTFDLAVARHLAGNPSERIGSLLVDPGGPGFPGTDFALNAEANYSQYLTDHFDIVAWDPRGTGQSTPFIDCVSDYDKYFASEDITPDDDAARQQIIDLAKEFQHDCSTKNGAILQHVGTNDSARDMDSIRKALGEDKISYFGFSYGSELGATWATLFPDTVRAAVLDGATDPKSDFLTSSLQQEKGFEDALDNFLASCSKDSTCVFRSGGDAAGAFDELMASLDAKPVPSDPGRPDVNLQVALGGVIQAMYSQSLWPTLAQALHDAQGGNGSGLLALYDLYYQRQPDGTYDNSLEAFQVISCMDVADRLTVAQDDANAPKFTAIAPRLAPKGTTGSYFCSFFPKSEQPRIEITGTGAGPILVVGTTGDPATPLSSSQAMADDLQQGVLLTVVGNQHTGYHISQCSQDTVDHYLVDLTVPAKGTKCG